MNSHFLNGFADELVKESAHPLSSDIVKGGTLLGRKVSGMMSRAMNDGKVRKFRMQKKAEEACGPGCAEGKHREGCKMKEKFGGGKGNFEGKQAPPFTDKVNPTDMPKAFGKQPK